MNGAADLSARLFVILTAKTGARRAETLSLDWTDIDFGARKVRFKNTGQHAERIFFDGLIDAETVSALRLWQTQWKGIRQNGEKAIFIAKTSTGAGVSMTRRAAYRRVRSHAGKERAVRSPVSWECLASSRHPHTRPVGESSKRLRQTPGLAPGMSAVSLGSNSGPATVLPTPKISRSDREGIGGWVPFHAAYSFSFARAALKMVSEAGDTVLDPFSGSGTTARAARVENRNSISIDLNPVSTTLTRAILSTHRTAEQVVEKISTADFSGEPLARSLDRTPWIHPRTLGELVQWCAYFDKLPAAQRNFAWGVALTSAREICSMGESSNPTWPKPLARRAYRDVRQILARNALSMWNDLIRETEGIHETSKHRLLRANSIALPLRSDSVEGFLTSPPYLSRIDYIRSAFPELSVLTLGSENRYSGLRRQLMGGVQVPGEVSSIVVPSSIARSTLAEIHDHCTKASKTYYSILARQYFADFALIINELWRVTRPGGRGAVVVQSSYYKDVEIRLPDIAKEIGEASGFSVEIHHAESVRQHYGRLCPRQRRYVDNKVLTESVILFEKPL